MLAVTDVINQAKLPFVIFNTGTAIVTDQSPYFVRPTYTNYTHYYPLGRYAGMQGLKKCVAVAADYAPGQDSVVAVSEGFKKEGGEVIDKIMIPLDATDYSSYLQRIKDASPECAFVFMPLGPSALAFVKAYLDRGLLKSGIKFFGQSETNEPDLASDRRCRYRHDHRTLLRAEPRYPREQEIRYCFPGEVWRGSHPGHHQSCRIRCNACRAEDGGDGQRCS